ncbi:hypothetical protein PMJ10TS2_56820 [Paenibacillus melissococcoides]
MCVGRLVGLFADAGRVWGDKEERGRGDSKQMQGIRLMLRWLLRILQKCSFSRGFSRIMKKFLQKRTSVA